MWEYEAETLALSDLAAVLSRRGREGWEAWQIFRLEGHPGAVYEVYFKRPIQVMGH